MFDARADGKRLGRHGHAQLVQHGEGVAGAVADGEDDVLRLHLHGCASAHAGRAAHAAIFDQQARQPRLKEHFPAQAHDLLPDGAHHGGQAVRAHVRARFPENLLRRAEAGQRFQHFAAMGVLDAGIEFAIGKGTRAALAELHIALRVERSAAPEGVHVARALVHAFAALDHQRGKAHARKRQRREQPRRAEADHQRAMVKGARRGQGARLRRGKALAAFRQRTERALCLHVEGEHKAYVALVARVHRALAQMDGGYVVRGAVKRPRGVRGEGRFFVVQREFELRYAYHALSLSFIARAASSAEAHAHCRL